MLTNYKNFFKQQKNNFFNDNTSYYLELNFIDLKCDSNFNKSDIPQMVEEWNNYSQSGEMSWGKSKIHIDKISEEIKRYFKSTFKKEYEKDPKLCIINIKIGSSDENSEIIIQLRCNKKEVIEKIASLYGIDNEKIEVQQNFYSQSND